MKQSPMPVTLQTERLTLRSWCGEDAGALAAAITISLDHLGPWMPWATGPVTGHDMTSRIYEWEHSRQHGGDTVLGIFLGDRVVGGCGLHHRAGPGIIDIGYWIHVDHIAVGYASEVATALTDATHDLPGIRAIRIEHDYANVRSSAVPRRIGYRLVAVRTRPPEAPAEVGILATWATTPTLWHQHRCEPFAGFT